MTFLSVLVLSIGMSTAPLSVPSHTLAAQAQANLNRMVAAVSIRVGQQALSSALADATHQGQLALERQMAAARQASILPRKDMLAPRAKRTLDRMVAEAQPRLQRALVAQALITLGELLPVVKAPETTQLAGIDAPRPKAPAKLGSMPNKVASRQL